LSGGEYPDTLGGDVQLAKAATAGQTAAAEILVARYRPLIERIAARYYPNHADGEELLGRVAQRLWADGGRALREWQPQARLSCFIATVAIRLCLDDKRASIRRPPAAALPDADTEASSAAGPVGLVERREMATILWSALGALSPRDRYILRLRFIEEIRAAQIGQMLNISEGAARKAVFDALKRLRTVLGRRHPDLFGRRALSVADVATLLVCLLRG